jgi:hypothetical protein
MEQQEATRRAADRAAAARQEAATGNEENGIEASEHDDESNISDILDDIDFSIREQIFLEAVQDAVAAHCRQGADVPPESLTPSTARMEEVDVSPTAATLRFPALYRVTAEAGAAVVDDISDIVKRTIPTQVVVLCIGAEEWQDGTRLQVPDGWILESSVVRIHTIDVQN